MAPCPLNLTPFLDPLPLPGVAQVNINGQKRFAVRVHARPDELAARGLTLDDLASAIRSAKTIFWNGPMPSGCGHRI